MSEGRLFVHTTFQLPAWKNVTIRAHLVFNFRDMGFIEQQDSESSLNSRSVIKSDGHVTLFAVIALSRARVQGEVKRRRGKDMTKLRFI